MTKETIYTQELKPLVDQIIAICERERIDTILHFQLDAMQFTAGPQALCCTTVMISEDSTLRMCMAADLLGPEDEDDEDTGKAAS